MLILTRRVAEVLRIGDHLQVTVLGIEGNRVRLGFSGPTDLPILREELYQRIQAEKASEVKS
jgi:carbon storage regulator